MRKITKDAIRAFLQGRPFKRDNTRVVVYDRMYDDWPDTVALLLHGNEIARKEVDSQNLRITNAGWFSNTTKERLNGLPGVSIYQSRGVWYLNGEEWGGDWAGIPT